jgi:rRNA pseudouridine-1189 N-methylase Emg1 (Nep1/Mra1 family)
MIFLHFVLSILLKALCFSALRKLNLSWYNDLMEHLLDGCKVKVARAKELIENLNNEVSTFLNNGGCQVISRHKLERRGDV